MLKESRWQRVLWIVNGNHYSTMILTATMSYYNGRDELGDYEEDTYPTRELVVKLEGTTDRVKVQSTDSVFKVYL